MNVYFYLMLAIGLVVASAMSVLLIRAVLGQLADEELRLNPPWHRRIAHHRPGVGRGSK
ncbi:hypothetical protein OIE66_06690 [Nonomuraea sp. NBC_01738]|uniref:hypothetical protein n=1 Tax=Nonomuraea sp. NBC_01738 TaxID=2976003 RepID=UPI002E160461|nr:hypothetical protein OIE66_06690 [Nonomuraea sp. NBC_01738]